MEIKINREIKDFAGSIFFGLSLRQLIFSGLAIIVAIGLHFMLQGISELETGWICVLGAAPFGAMGFFKYQGMPFEQFAWCWIKSQIMMPRKLCFEGENTNVLAYQFVLQNTGRKGVDGAVPDDTKSSEKQ